MIFDRHANLKYKYGNRKFWAAYYYVPTVGLNETTIAKYIREQEAEDIVLDKLSVKEYEDPFADKQLEFASQFYWQVWVKLRTLGAGQ